MTLVMQDSVVVANLTPGADAYLGYTDGRFATYGALKARFPGARLLSMSVFAADDAEGCDREPGDLAVSQVAGWVKRQVSRNVWRPVVYASASNMGACMDALRGALVARPSVRLLSAHYGAGRHVCGPATCNFPGCPAVDGTQWTDSAPGAGGSKIDESILNDDFFEEITMAITPADAQAIARAVWSIDGLVAAPAPTPGNPFWTPERMLTTIAQQTGAQAATVAADVLKGLSPATIADAIASALGPAVGQEVVTALSAKLAAK